MTAAIAVDGIWKFYGDYAALRDISLNIEPDRAPLSSAGMAQGRPHYYR